MKWFKSNFTKAHILGSLFMGMCFYTLQGGNLLASIDIGEFIACWIFGYIPWMFLCAAPAGMLYNELNKEIKTSDYLPKDVQEIVVPFITVLVCVVIFLSICVTTACSSS